MSKEIGFNEDVWDLEIKPSSNLFRLNLREVLKYRDLLYLFVKRDITTVYKQTILGPIWFFVQPILTSLTFMLVFGKIANLSTDGVPQALFYLSGVILWTYFSAGVTATSNTFIANANIFGKVYFPRLVSPIAIVISNILKFGIQLIPFFALWIYYISKGEVHPNFWMVLVPLIIIQIAVLSMGLGLIISALTTKYRDFNFLIAFCLQLLMYGSSVIYPLSKVDEKYRIFLELNPMTWVIESFKHGFIGAGVLDFNGIVYSWLVTLFLFFSGVFLFNKVERSFMDTV